MDYPFFPFKLRSNGNGEFSIAYPYADEPLKVNAAAADLLQLCDGSTSMETVVAKLAGHFCSPLPQIRESTSSLITDLIDLGLIWTKQDAMRWFRPPAPPLIFWEITAECNLKCRHCVVSADTKLDRELSTRQALTLIAEWAAMGVREIAFSGGEPLIREDFFELAQAARASNLNLELATNGTLITASSAKMLKALGVDVQVSLDGSNADIYCKVRGRKDAFDAAVEGITRLVAVGCSVTIGTVVNTRNVEDVPEVLNLAERIGVQRFRLIPFIPYGRGKRNRDLELSPDAMREVTTFLMQQRGKSRVEIVQMEFEHTFGPPPAQSVDPSQPSECGGAVQYCTVTPIGEVLPCHFFEGVNTDCVQDHPFSWIWTHSRFLNYFRSMRIGDIKGHCRQCAWLPVCRGGCKAANFSHHAMFESNRHCWLVTERKN